MKKTKRHPQLDDARFWKNQRLLVLSPHPDDEAFGCGGTMAKAKALGCKVYLMIFSVGDLKFFEKKQMVTASKRVKEVEKVRKLLKLDGVDVLFTDAESHLRLDSFPRRDLVALIEKGSSLSFEKIRPTMVALPAPSYNQDHEAVFEAGLTSCRVHAGGYKHTPETVLVYDSPTLYWNEENRKFHPNLYVDISKYLNKKMAHVRCYASQSRHENDPTSLSSIRDLAHVRGREVGRKAAEAFVAYRLVF